MIHITSMNKGLFFNLYSLALMRIGIGTTLLIDIILRLSDFQAFYSTKGLVPQGSYFGSSFYRITQSDNLQIILFLISLVAAVSLIFGFKTRISSIISWIFYISIVNSNPFVNSGADYLLLSILFIGIFLPWHIKFSLDSPDYKGSANVLTAGTLAYALHLATLYFFAGIFKINEGWLSNHTLEIALSYLPFQTDVGKILLQSPHFISALQLITPVFEISAPLLLFLPYKNNLCRLLGIFLLVFFHIGIWLSLELGLFSLVAIIGLVGVLPGVLWKNYKLSLSSLPSSRTNSKNLYIPKINSFILFSVIIYIFIYNIIYLLKVNEYTPKIFKLPASIFALPTKWDMYATHPLESYWIYITVEFKNRSQTFPLNTNPQTPSYDTFLYQNHRWKKYINSVILGHRDGLTRKILAEYICRNQKQVQLVSIYRSGKKYAELNKYTDLPLELIYKYKCPFN